MLTAAMTKARFVPGMEDRRRGHIERHADLVAAIREGDAINIEKLPTQHGEEMVRIV